VSKDPVTLTVKLKTDDEAVVRPDLIALLNRLNNDDGEGPRIVLDEVTFKLGTWNEALGHGLRERIEEALAERPISVEVEMELKSKRSGRRAAVVIASSSPPALTPMEQAALDASRADDDARRIVALLRAEGELLGAAIRDRLSLSPAALADALNELEMANIIDGGSGEDDDEEPLSLNSSALWAYGHPLAQQLRAEEEAFAALPLRDRVLRLLQARARTVAELVEALAGPDAEDDAGESAEQVEAELDSLYGDALVDLSEGVWSAVEQPPADEPAPEPEQEQLFDTDALGEEIAPKSATIRPDTVIDAGDIFARAAEQINSGSLDRDGVTVRASVTKRAKR
jgi:DNA-binding Lrp family transcriptional regulator